MEKDNIKKDNKGMAVSMMKWTVSEDRELMQSPC